jgi:hypothetical protein
MEIIFNCIPTGTLGAVGQMYIIWLSNLSILSVPDEGFFSMK